MVELVHPKTRETVTWTHHAREKMKFYKLSEQRLLRVLRHPKRIEKGIVPYTTACMQRTNTRHPTEIWIMYQSVKTQNTKTKTQKNLRIITAWRYPGISPVREEIPIPEDIRREIQDIV